MKTIIQIGDKPNKNGRIYPTEILRREAERFTNEYVMENRAFVCKNPPSELNVVNLLDVIGQIKYIGMEDNNLIADVELLKDINGSDQIWPLFENGKLSLRTAGIGTVTTQPDGTIKIEDDYELISLFLTDDPA